ncbi:MAG: NUDIX hydrolase N-terminal domain-containing protein, partial [Candidatus Acidiferrum sp.]
MAIPDWLTWAQRLQAISQTGLTYCKDKFDIQRYKEIREIAAELMAAGATGSEPARIANLFIQQTGYATPKVDVRVAAFKDNDILLV